MRTRYGVGTYIGLVTIALIACVDHVVHAQGTLVGKVVEVIDGDTITLLDPELRRYRIRLSGIDAPEVSQPFGQASHQYLVSIAFEKLAQAQCYKLDRYNRNICTVNVDGKDVALLQLEAGLAWWYRQYAIEQTPSQRLEYEMAETNAAANVLGLWKDENRVPPWDWRKRGKE